MTSAVRARPAKRPTCVQPPEHVLRASAQRSGEGNEVESRAPTRQVPYSSPPSSSSTSALVTSRRRRISASRRSSASVASDAPPATGAHQRDALSPARAPPRRSRNAGREPSDGARRPRPEAASSPEARTIPLAGDATRPRPALESGHPPSPTYPPPDPGRSNDSHGNLSSHFSFPTTRHARCAGARAPAQQTPALHAHAHTSLLHIARPYDNSRGSRCRQRDRVRPPINRLHDPSVDRLGTRTSSRHLPLLPSDPITAMARGEPPNRPCLLHNRRRPSRRHVCGDPRNRSPHSAASRHRRSPTSCRSRPRPSARTMILVGVVHPVPAPSPAPETSRTTGDGRAVHSIFACRSHGTPG